ncbi:MAG: outer membrane lipoprotein-sorting protein [Desulfobacter sp.]|nr:MAG: outer membrane lipoprotein-sorting protein [Desulfobacter sp.]
MTFIKQRGDRFFRCMARTLFRHRFKTLIVVLGLFLALAANLGRLGMDVSTEGFLHKEDPSLLAYNEFKHQFGNDDLILIAVEPERVFTLEFFKLLKRMHTELEAKVPYIDDITSLVNARNTFGQDDSLYVRDLCDPFPETQAEVDDIRERVAANPLYKDMLISEDGGATCIVIKLVASPRLDEADLFAGFEAGEGDGDNAGGVQGAWLTVEQNGEAVEAVWSVLDSYRDKGLKISLSGTASVNHFLKGILSADTQRFLKLGYLGVMIFLVVMFRRVTGVVAPILIVTLSLVSALSLMAVTGITFKIPTQILPSFILAVGVGYSVHILALFYKRLKKNPSREAAVVHAMGHSGLAVVLTGLTTAAGLFSFSGSEVAPIAELGLFGGAGVFFAMFYTFTLLPPILSFARRPKADPAEPGKGLDRLLSFVARVSTRYPLSILAISLALFFLACVGIFRLNFSHDVLRWLPDTEALRIESEHIDEILKGSVNMEIIVDTGRENGLYDPEFMARIEAAAGRIAAIEATGVTAGKVWSIADVLKETHRALHNNRDEFYTLPDTRELTAQELFLFSNSGSDDLEDFTDAQFSLARVSVKLPFIDAIAYTDYIHRVNEILAKEFPGLSVETTGLIMIFSKVIAAGINSMGLSYLYAFCTISLMMILLLGNLRIGLVAMIPNLMPIVIILGIAGWFSIPVSLFIMLVGNIAMGLAVDDTIHFMHNFRHYLDKTGDTAEAVKETLITVGRPMVVTSIVLSMGFFIYLFSAMNHLTHFGLLTGWAILIALAADFFLAPALVTVFFGKKRIRVSKLANAKAAIALIPALMLVCSFVKPAAAQEGTDHGNEKAARAIMTAVDQRYDGDDRTASMTMVLVDKNNKQRVRRLKAFTRDDGDDTWSAMFFLAPVDVRETGFLSHDIDKTNDDDQWLYLPALHKVKRIASDDKTASFMGSDLSYADMTDRELDLYDFKILKEAEVRGAPCWVIQSLPRTAQVVEDFGYTKSILFVRKDCHVVVRAIHFVKEGNRLKYLDIPRLEKIDGIWTVMEMQVATKKGKTTLHRTILRYNDVAYNQGLEKNIFTTRQLEKGVN